MQVRGVEVAQVAAGMAQLECRFNRVPVLRCSHTLDPTLHNCGDVLSRFEFAHQEAVEVKEDFLVATLRRNRTAAQLQEALQPGRYGACENSRWP